jgi:CBS-domain-containing membrane protein
VNIPSIRWNAFRLPQVMSQSVVSVPAPYRLADWCESTYSARPAKTIKVIPWWNRHGKLRGIITKSSLLEEWFSWSPGDSGEPQHIEAIIGYDLVLCEPLTAFLWESCRTAAERRAQNGIGRLVIVDDDDPSKPIGILMRNDLLSARTFARRSIGASASSAAIAHEKRPRQSALRLEDASR